MSHPTQAPGRESPSNEQFDELVRSSRAEIMNTIRNPRRPRWRCGTRIAIAATVLAGGGAATGIAIATNRAPEPDLRTGDTTITLTKPGPGDEWLNINFSFKCRPNEQFALRSAKKVLLEGDCNVLDAPVAGQPAESTTGINASRLGSRGIIKSIPISEVTATELVLESNLTENYLISATYGVSASQQAGFPLPSRDPKPGESAWDYPEYEVNEYGLTVGARTLNTPESAWPDLFGPINLNGEDGYFRRDDLKGEIAGNPAEALQQMKRLRDAGILDDDGTIWRNVYGPDGKTLLGKIKVGYTSAN